MSARQTRDKRGVLFISLISGVLSASLVMNFLQAGVSKDPSMSSPAAINEVWVMREDNSLSCDPKSGEALEIAAQALEKKKIQVLGRRKAEDGKMHAQSCGIPTGRQNALKIRRADLKKAKGLGFQIVDAK